MKDGFGLFINHGYHIEMMITIKKNKNILKKEG